RPKSRRRKSKGRIGGRRRRREKAAIGTAVAKQIGKAVLALDMAVADLDLEQRGQPPAHAQAELVRIGNLELVVDEAQFAPTARSRLNKKLCAAFGGEIDGIPREARRPGVARIVGITRDEVEGSRRERSDADFLLEEIELVAIVRAAVAA